MRAAIILFMFTVSLAHASWSDYREKRELELSSTGVNELVVESGAGSLEIHGHANGDEIRVEAVIDVPGKSDDKAQALIAEKLVLTLDKKGGSARLVGDFKGLHLWGDSPAVHLTVSMPERLGLGVNDSSGSIEIGGVRGNISVKDSSGSIRMREVGGSIKIDDSSGSIEVSGVGESIVVEDGSGSIKIRDVEGSVTVDDGSGSVDVKRVGQDLIIVDDGSGSLRYSDIKGNVEDNS